MKKWQRNLAAVVVSFCCMFTLASGILLVIHHENIGKVFQVVHAIEREFLWDTSADSLTDGAVIGLMESLDDKYSSYIDEEQMASFRQSISGEVYGIGVYLATNADGDLEIISPMEDSPAAEAGIQPGDIVVAVNDTEVAGMDEDVVVGMLRGLPEEKVMVTIRRNGETFEYKIGRYIIGTTKTVDESMLEDHPGIGYLRITKFSAQTSKEVVDALNGMVKEGMQGLVLDLRNNGGGDVGSAVEIARIFVTEGPILHIVYKNDKTTTYSATGAQLQIPVVVLVNGNSASASEILAGALKDSKSATLIGSKTFGKGLVQGVYFLNDGTAIKMTQAKYLTPNKNDINGVGITPDVVIEGPEVLEEGAIDGQLQKAIEVVEKKCAQTIVSK